MVLSFSPPSAASGLTALPAAGFGAGAAAGAVAGAPWAAGAPCCAAGAVVGAAAACWAAGADGLGASVGFAGTGVGAGAWPQAASTGPRAASPSPRTKWRRAKARDIGPPLLLNRFLHGALTGAPQRQSNPDMSHMQPVAAYRLFCQRVRAERASFRE